MPPFQNVIKFLHGHPDPTRNNRSSNTKSTQSNPWHPPKFVSDTVMQPPAYPTAAHSCHPSHSCKDTRILVEIGACWLLVVALDWRMIRPVSLNPTEDLSVPAAWSKKVLESCALTEIPLKTLNPSLNLHWNVVNFQECPVYVCIKVSGSLLNGFHK